MKFIPFLMLATASTAMLAIHATAAQAPVDLGTSGNFVILSKSGISTTGVTSITGNIGVSPINQGAITGFSETLDPSGEFSRSDYVTGRIYAADYATPTPSILATAIGDMGTAYSDAAGRSLPDTSELGAGNISGLTIEPGLHKWGSGVSIDSDAAVTLSGGPDEVWIFQIAQNLTIGTGATVELSGGAQAANIFWQIAGEATLGTHSHFEGILLVETAIKLSTGATIDGRLLAQTGVTLEANTVTNPTSLTAGLILEVVSISRAAGGDVTLTFTVTPGHSITLQDSIDLVNWTDVSTEIPIATPYVITEAVALSDPRRFYRAFYQ